MTVQENDAAAASPSNIGRVSSPASTGGAGTFFEQNVAAYWLAQLLVRGVPPILIDSVVAEVHLQTEHLRWNTDDFLIVCERPGAAAPKLVGQVKRSFLVSAADGDCKQAIQDFWKDFKSSDRFSPAEDRLVLVTLRGTDTLLKHFVGLLDCARAARDGAEFEHRLATNGFISDKAVKYCDELLKIIGDLEGQPVTAADIWPFLRVLHVLSLDLDTSTRQTEAHIKSLLSHTATEGDAVGAAGASWNALLAIASTAMSEAHSLLRADLPEELRQRHASVGTNEQRVLRALKDHTGLILRGIRSTIGQGLHLQRAALVQKVLGELETAQVVLVSGPAGSGKSVIGKDAVSLLSQDHFTFGFRVEEFAQPHFDATLHAGQIPANATTLSAILAAQGRKVVLVESVERLLEKTTRDAFSDLMTLAVSDRGMRVVLTCRDYSIDQVRASFLQPAGIKHANVSVPPLDDAELTEVEAGLPALVYPLKNPSLRNILRNPYFLDKALEISWSAERPVPESEREFRALFWREIVRADHRVPAGMARRREEVFQTIAVRRARALSAYVVCNDLDPAVIAALRQDSVISSPDENPLLVATADDVLEDWAILQWLEEQHLTGEGSFKDLSAAIGTHPAVRRSYRKWVAELVERDAAAADQLFREAIAETEITAQFRDDTLVSLLRAPSSPEFLLRHEPQLVANDRALLKRVIHLLRVACVTTPVWLAGATGHGSIFNVPDGLAWATVLRLVHRHID
ncbi:MAG: AAA family ATPase, partial [Candidatus Methylomirabilaceae bacterium]